MLSSNSAPLLFAATILVAGAMVGVQAAAAEPRLSDVKFVNAAQCAGLAKAFALEGYASPSKTGL